MNNTHLYCGQCGSVMKVERGSSSLNLYLVKYMGVKYHDDGTMTIERWVSIRDGKPKLFYCLCCQNSLDFFLLIDTTKDILGGG